MHRVFRDPGFRTHFIVYAAVNAGLLVINLLTKPGVLWFQWPLLGWGLGILGHAYLVNRTPEPVPGPQTATASSEPPMGSAVSAAKIDERARQLWEAHGAKAIAEVADHVRASTASGNAAEAETWRRIEAALIAMRGPRAS